MKNIWILVFAILSCSSAFAQDCWDFHSCELQKPPSEKDFKMSYLRLPPEKSPAEPGDPFGYGKGAIVEFKETQKLRALVKSPDYMDSDNPWTQIAVGQRAVVIEASTSRNAFLTETLVKVRILPPCSTNCEVGFAVTNGVFTGGPFIRNGDTLGERAGKLVSSGFEKALTKLNARKYWAQTMAPGHNDALEAALVDTRDGAGTYAAQKRFEGLQEQFRYVAFADQKHPYLNDPRHFTTDPNVKNPILKAAAKSDESLKEFRGQLSMASILGTPKVKALNEEQVTMANWFRTFDPHYPVPDVTK